MIHPFEDGNGRIGRAIAEKVLAQGAGQPSLTALSLLIRRRGKDYYAQLEAANKTLDIDPWLHWFADLVLAAQEHTLQGLDFLLANTRLWDRLRGQLNERQEKALFRLMRAGIDGFVGGLAASKFMALTGAPAIVVANSGTSCSRCACSWYEPAHGDCISSDYELPGEPMPPRQKTGEVKNIRSMEQRSVAEIQSRSRVDGVARSSMSARSHRHPFQFALPRTASGVPSGERLLHRRTMLAI